MNPFFAGWRAARLRNSPPALPRSSTTRLVLLELGWLTGQILRPSRSLPAAAVGITTATLLAPVTPGPVVGTAARVGVGAAGAVVAAVVAHVMLARVGDDDASPSTVALVGAATAGLLLGVAVVLTHVLGALAPGAIAEGRLIGGGLAVDRALAFGAGLLVLGVLATGLVDRLRVPGSLALLGVGMIVGSDGLGWVLVDDPLQVQTIAVVALVVILYEGGLTTRVHALRGAVVPGVLLATVGVAITAGVVAAIATSMLGLSPGIALLLAAVVASTDAAAVFAALRQAPVPRRLAAVLQVESGTNDPVAVLLTVGLLSGAELGAEPTSWLGFAVAQLGVGAAMGLTLGVVGAWMLARVALAAAALLPVLALAIGAAAYGVTALVGGSGFLAVYVCGMVVAARTPGARRSLRNFHEGLATVVEIGLFLLLGLLVFPAELPDVLGVGVGIAAALLLIARPLAVALTLGPFGFRLRQLAAISWLGMRGAVPIVLATVAFSAGFDEATFVLDVVFVVVLVSTLVQGTTAPSVVRWLGLEAAPEPEELAIDSSPFEGADGELVELSLRADSPLVGHTFRELPPPPGVLVTAIVRDGRIVVPRGGTRLRADDQLVIVSDRPAVVPVLRRWAGPGDTRQLVDRDAP